MALRKAKGFTLVELLVVITIIGMLMALLLPAIQSAREAGRRNTCANNIRQVQIALNGFHDSKRSFPGYANVVGNKRASWVVSLLPYFERNDLYQLWQNNQPVDVSTMANSIVTGTQLSGGVNPNPWAFTTLNLLICPSNPAANTSTLPNPLSYVVNCGSASTANDLNPSVGMTSWVEDINSGVFFNNCRADYAAGGAIFNPYSLVTPTNPVFSATGPKVSMDYISTNDGTSNTLMVAENLQATNWAMDQFMTTSLATPTPLPWQSEFAIKMATGFVWYVTGNINNAEPTSATNSSYNILAYKINAQARTGPPFALNYDPAATPPTGGLAVSRPSSAHPGGVNTMFCDGHLRFISEDIQYHVYTQLMTPKQTGAVKAYSSSSGSTPVGSTWTYTLNEADY